MIMRSRKSRRWIIAGVVVLTLIGFGIAVVARSRATRAQQYLCWDAPSTGSPAKYVVSFDDRTREELTGECVRVPAALTSGEHVAVVRAIDAFGQLSPPASIRFVVP
jgi:hypothetical protein